ncbi:MAG: 3-hydroxyacyl-CoA dehydrogenase family protein [Sandaracinus sp.]|nr:3-hydroxyacyl-CoA dehydrogenase family protein [Sandaracinus sp.]MCB9620196.1 3-hydroxyacyl-CoA dehydrogenase family protein [Sandaracinus sp.]MCB9625519.1 3-hydroxyacyl-CoA dehydrogenase family protein [Sandaracinus sp.]
MEIRKVAVLGAGTMGHGIAQVCASSGFQVALGDVSDVQLAKAVEKVRGSLEKLASKGRLQGEVADVLGRLSVSSSMDSVLDGADLVIEAVPEKMELKLELFRVASAKAPAHAIFATNTSSLSVTEIAADTGRAERVVGLHFFNPVPVMELLEIVRGLSTDDATIEAAVAFAKRIGKDPVVVKDWPGFATSRLGIILGCEAIRMVEQGVASPADIDKAMKLGYRHPMGPLELTDLVGLDVRLAIMEHLFAELGEQFRPPALLRQMVRAGKLGRKSGEGFYTY